MRIWYDACTGKHVRYGAAIAGKLRSLGHELVMTTRDHPDTIALAKFLKEEVSIVGRYAPSSLSSRLRESLKRQLQLLETFEGAPPDFGVSHGSVDLCRVAFGLGVPTISTADSPHATAVNRLGLPLVKYLVISKAFPKELYRKYGTENIVQFEGVDEVAWINSYKPVKVDCEKPLIVVRQAETRAAYAEGKEDITLKVARRLEALGNVVFVPRYERRREQGLNVLQDFADTTSLVAYADLVVGVGGTMAREAALQGTPSLVIPLFGHSHVNTYLAKKGFPIFSCSLEDVPLYAKKYLAARKNVKDLLGELEDPVKIITRLIVKEDKFS